MTHDVLGWQVAAPWLGLAALIGYLLGSIPFSAIVARLRGLGDLRKVGSGNIGATNVLRTGDRLGAALALGGDALKGAAAALLMGQWGPLAAMAAGLGAVLGHIFPLFLRFRGGKGVATCAGVIFGLHWPTGLCLLGAWIASAALTRYSSLSALLTAAVAPLCLWLFGQYGLVLFGAALAALIWITHAQNIRRLLAGEESKIGAKK